ncbi:MAG TPA: hypothetical protein VER36_00700 [Flavisolibacter sp.]|nr:hypothetical protein [Flavisolibacter sp.]
MPAIDPKPDQTSIKKPATLHLATTFVDTNGLLKSAIQQLPAELRSEIVLRCDELALLQGSEEAIGTAFSQLLQMIIDEREAGKKLFLHITCAKQTEAMLTGGQRFLIRFHANITLHASWMEEADRRINSIASLLLPYGGSLLVNQLKNAGCVFCITLPGK